MDFLKPQRKVPRPKLSINTGHFRPTPINHYDIPTEPTDLKLYSTNNEYLATDTIQKMISQHHFNQQVNITLPIPKSNSNHAIIKVLNDAIYEAIQHTYVYHLQCDLSLLFTEPFVSHFFPTAIQPATNSKQPSKSPHILHSQISLYATTTHTTLLQNSFTICNNNIFFNLDKDSYQSLGFTAPYNIINNNMYQFKIPINKATIHQLQTKLSYRHISSLPFILFATKNNISIPIDITLLQQSYQTQKLIFDKLDEKLMLFPSPLHNPPSKTLPVILPTTTTTTNSTTTTTKNDTTTTEPLIFKRLLHRFQSIPSPSTGETPPSTSFTTIPHLPTDSSSTTTTTTSTPATTIPTISYSTSNVFPYLTTTFLQTYINSFFLEKKYKANAPETQCINNVKKQIHKNVSLMKSANKKFKSTQQLNNKNLTDDDGDDNNNDDIDSSSDSDDDDDDDIIQPNYISHYVQKVKEKTSQPPKIPTEIYQLIAQQLQLFISLLLTNNTTYWYHVDKRAQYNTGQDYNPSHYIFSQLQFQPKISKPTEQTNGHLQFSIRGILPPCFLIHLFKQLRFIFTTTYQSIKNQSNDDNDMNNNNNNNNTPFNSDYCIMTTYGIPNAVCNYNDKFHGDSAGLGGNGESNYTIILTQRSLPAIINNNNNNMNDNNNDNDNNNQHVNAMNDNEKETKTTSSYQLTQEAFILFRNVDHQSKEF